MRLEKKQEYKPVPVKSTQRVYTDKMSLSDVEMDEEVGNGKYRNKTARWISENDSSYFQWMYNSGMLVAWGLIRDPLEQPKRTYAHHVTPEGECWLSIYGVECKTNPSIFLED